MAENEAHLQIGIEAAGAIASARLIEDALKRVALLADQAQKKLDALSKVRAPAFRAPASAPTTATPPTASATPTRATPAATSAPQTRTASPVSSGAGGPSTLPSVSTVVGLDKLRRDITEVSASLQNLPSPKISVANLTREFRSVSAELAKLTATDLSKLGEDGAESIRKMQDRVVELTRLIKEARDEGIRATNLKQPDFIGPRTTPKAQDADRRALMERVPATSPTFVGPASPDTRAVRAAEKAKTDAMRAEAADRERLWARSAQEQDRHSKRLLAEAKADEKAKTAAMRAEAAERSRQWARDAQEQQRHTRRLAAESAAAARESREADRRRMSMTPAPSSASFVGPMPETRYQASQRQDEDKRATYDAGAAISKMARNISPKVNIDTSGAIKQVEGLRNAFAKVGDAAMSMQGAIAGAGLFMIGRDIARAGMAMSSLESGFKAATGSAAEAKVEMERLKTETNRLGIDMQHTGKEYVNFVAAIRGSNVDAEKAKDAFFGVAQAMSLLGRSPEGTARAFKALEQFASKGRIMSEELRGQLAEQLPGAFNITAKAMGMTADELSRAMEEGRVSAKALFDVFGEAVKQTYPVSGQVDSATASFARFNNAIFELKATIANGGFLKALAEGAEEAAKFMRGDEGKKMANDLGVILKDAITALIGTFRFLVENIETVKTVLVSLIAIRAAAWAFEMGKALTEMAVQFLLLGRYLAGHPLLALATTALAGAAALYALSKSTKDAQKSQLSHNAAVKELNELRGKLKSTDAIDKQEIQNTRDKITAIRDLAREEQKRLDDKIKKTEQIQKMEDAMAATGLGADVGGIGAGGIAGLFGWNDQDEDLERQRREKQQARAREQMATEMLRPKTSGSSTPGYVVGTPQADELAKATAELDKQIAALDKQFQAFEMNAGAAAQLTREMERQKALMDEFGGGKVTTEGLDIIAAKMEEVAQKKDLVAAGPIIQDLNTGILDLYKLADAHKQGVDAANAEKIAQEARNKAVQAGISISGDAAAAIARLSQAHSDAAFAAEMAERTAGLQRQAQTAREMTRVLTSTSGESRIAGAAKVEEAASLNVNLDNMSPTVKNAERLAPIFEAGKTAVVQTNEALAQQTYEMDLQIKSMRVMAGLEKGQSEAKARQLGEEKALSQLRTNTPGGVGLGNVDRKDLSEEQKKFIAKSGEMEAQQWKIRQNNKVGRAAPQDIFGERLRELQENIEAQQQLASAHGQGAEAVEQMTRKQEILNQVHGLSEKLTAKQKAQLEGLIGTLYDAKTAAQFEGAKMDLRIEIEQIYAMAAAQYESADAANAEAVAQEARRMAIQLGVSNDKDAIRSLEELVAARQRAQQAQQVVDVIQRNREQIEALEDERKALDAVGAARIRLRAEQETRRNLRSEGVPEEAPRFRKAVETSGDAAVEDFTFAQEQSIESTKRQVVAIGEQSAAMSLLGEDYIRRNAELQMEAQLLEQTGEATSDLAQQQIQLAGDMAVATDRLGRQNDALRQLANSGLTFNEQMRSISADGLGHMEDALVDIIMGTKSVKEAFADMARSIAADLARMAVRQAITIPIAMAMNSMFMGGLGVPGGMAPPSASFIGPMPAMVGHTGGIAGRDISATRMVDPGMFQNAPRFHAGMPNKMPKLTTNEMPAVIKKDEGVFTPAQMQALGPAGGNQTVVVSPTINVNQPPGATEDQGQRFGRGIMREIQGLVDERINRAFKPGGIRNQTGLGA